MGLSTMIAQARGTACEAAGKDVLERSKAETVDAGVFAMVKNDDVVACIVVVCEDVPVLKTVVKMLLRQYLSRNPPLDPPRGGG